MLEDVFDLANVSLAPKPAMTAYLDKLNPEQREAVEAVDGPVLVLAGAGTGKTRVLTTRIAHILMMKKAFPGQILAVTFTNKAAGEMRERVDALLRSADEQINGLSDEPTRSSDHPIIQSSGIWLGTFHSIGAKILRRHAEMLGFTSTFTILDSDDQHRLIKQLLVEENIDNTKFPGKVVLSIIQGWKDKGLRPEKVGRSNDDYGVGAVAAKIYPIYQARLKTLNAMDFGDLLLNCLTLFTEHQPVLADYANRFRYILVDEYQDTNVAQYLWLRLLAMGHRNICCVGDDDQSIYGWRGAEVGNILKFEKDFPGAHTVRLERNYRSTAPILAAASQLIAHNKSRLGKTLFTDRGDHGDPIRIKSVWDDAEEARFVAEEIEAYQRDKYKLNETAILVRAGFQTRGFEERFITLGIPYRVIGGLRFYERMEIRDAVAYLRVIAQPHDDLAFERIINTPKRGIGKGTMEQLHGYARSQNCSLYAAVEASLELSSDPTPAEPIKGKAAATLRTLMEQFSRWRSLVGSMNLAELTDLVLEESGYRAMWQLDKSPESVGRVENLKELVRALGEFTDIIQFLEHVGLVSDNGGNELSDDMVNIMSLHAAKGLEFDIVFLTGWEEGLFPSQRTMDESGTQGLEEERRLAYVGITRAKKHCVISHAANRRIYNQWQSSIPSRFLQELPQEHVEILDGGVYSQRASGPAMFQKELDAFLNKSVSDYKSLKESVQSRYASTPHATGTAAPREAAWKKGQPVFHQKFGNGVILTVEGDHLTIAFKHAGTKKLMADYVKPA